MISTTECVGCGHKLRPYDAGPEDYPGTLKYVGRGRCSKCYKQSRKDDPAPRKHRGMTPKECGDCGVALRPNGTDVDEFPGTVRHRGHGRCGPCWRAHRRNPDRELPAGPQPVDEGPAVSPDRSAEHAASLAYYLTTRRRRGVPPQGVRAPLKVSAA